ncbi:MAG: hypothetical protein MUQ27_07585 [Acidimicrobiia bacterium]|nr:hypothetical protein [Acidimicrobiia bacterium]
MASVVGNQFAADFSPGVGRFRPEATLPSGGPSVRRPTGRCECPRVTTPVVEWCRLSSSFSVGGTRRTCHGHDPNRTLRPETLEYPQSGPVVSAESEELIALVVKAYMLSRP